MRTVLLVAAILICCIGCDVSELASTPTRAVTPSVVAPGPATPGSSPASTPTPSSAANLQSATVHRVVDGDTIIVIIAGREERLRYIGIDTPESVQPNTPVECFGHEASQANADLVEGRTVYLERDISDRDRFGRLLRYVYVDGPTGDLLFVNLELVAQGYAHAVTFPPDVRHVAALRAAERAARETERGLWAEC